MAKSFFFALALTACMGLISTVSAQDKAADVKKEDPVPPAIDANKSEQSGAQEPSAKIRGTDANPAALTNGTLSTPGASTDVDTAPSKFSSRTAADDQIPTAAYRLRHLSAAQKSSIYGELGKSATTSADGEAVVGAEVPVGLILSGLQPLPEAITAKFPELKGLAFAMLAGRTALVDPTMRIVVDVATQ
jgi:hypothetical protein